MFVCLFVRTITKNRTTPKCSNLAQRMNLEYPTSDMILGSKGQRSRLRGHKVQKHIEGDWVAGVSLHSIECLPSSLALCRCHKSEANILQILLFVCSDTDRHY